MPSKNLSLAELLFQAPWWVSVLASAFVYLLAGKYLPLIETDNQIFGMVFKAFSLVAPYFAFLILCIAPLSYLNERRKAKQLDSQRSVTSIRELHWRSFEELIAEAYRRKAYQVTEGGYGPDGGVDLELRKGGELVFVQCKQWKSQKIGISIIREMFGILSATTAARFIIICSGNFTQQAADFADGKPIELIDGQGLLSLIKDVQRVPQVDVSSPKSCPRCGSDLVERQAKRGKHAGNTFRGCSGFPECRHIE